MGLSETCALKVGHVLTLDPQKTHKEIESIQVQTMLFWAKHYSVVYVLTCLSKTCTLKIGHIPVLDPKNTKSFRDQSGLGQSLLAN